MDNPRNNCAWLESRQKYAKFSFHLGVSRLAFLMAETGKVVSQGWMNEWVDLCLSSSLPPPSVLRQGLIILLRLAWNLLIGAT